jgi:hypothetical protein
MDDVFPVPGEAGFLPVPLLVQMRGRGAGVIDNGINGKQHHQQQGGSDSC